MRKCAMKDLIFDVAPHIVEECNWFVEPLNKDSYLLDRQRWKYMLDNFDAILLIEFYLDRVGFTVHRAASAKDA